MTELAVKRGRSLRKAIENRRQRAVRTRSLAVEGKLVRMVGLTLEAVGCRAAVGDHCQVLRPNGPAVMTEVVGFNADRLILMPIGEARGLSLGAPVQYFGRGAMVPVGPELLGRVLSGTGVPIDDGGPLSNCASVPLVTSTINPLKRKPISEPIDVGIRAINALLTIGRGQRIGLFAGSGVGKSVLLGMMTRFTEADVVVVGLIGERGREVREFICDILGEEGMSRAVVVAAPADDPPLTRIRGAWLATRIAEHFRDEGKNVLLLMDSLTRYAMAQREVALAAGEPPASRGFPPSVFTKLPQLVERAGTGNEAGAITAIYTVLIESEDAEDPVADSAKAILDGHICLSRSLAEQGHFPAIDVEASVSRVMPAVTSSHHQQVAMHFRRLSAAFTENADLVNVGAYVKGSDPVLDASLELRPRMVAFLRQATTEKAPLADAMATLSETLGLPASDAQERAEAANEQANSAQAT